MICNVDPKPLVSQQLWLTRRLSGSPLLSRVATYYPNRSMKYVFLDIGYAAPPLRLTAAGIDALNNFTLATEGYEPSGYWSFFNRTGAGKVIDEHVRCATLMMGTIG